ncbi:MAG: hypothetical protein LZF62_430198 [Nitrospira sp.]|nr:MAG: hypothetical protein LZF62_430198 [Nitrospira sp.]
MNRLSIRKILSGIALGMTGIYLTLALTTAGCLLAHAAPSDGHHQHSGTESHSSLCSWACQATADAGPVSQGAGAVGWAAQSHEMSPLPIFIALKNQSSLHARAPPISARG